MPAVVSQPVVVLRAPSPETLRARLARGPAVVLIADLASIAGVLADQPGHAWAALPADATRDAIEAASRAVQAGLMALGPMHAGALAAGRAPRPVPRESEREVEALTPRERDVLQHLAEGLHNRGIAAALGISDHTVKFHLASIFGKLGASTRTEAVRIGLRRALVRI